MSERVVVVGAGLAGCAAATLLAERGFSVTLLEREDFLGGRAGAWADSLADGTPFEMERGFHGFFRQYKNLRALLRRVDPTLSMMTELEDYPLLGPGGVSQSFSGLPKLAPLNIIELIRRSPSIRFMDLRHADLQRAGAMLAFDHVRTFAELDHLTAKDYLDALRFPPKARQMLFDVFAHSFFNPEEDYSAAELLAMFHYYFTRNPDGLVFDVVNEPFGTCIWAPLERYMTKLGVRIELRATVSHVERQEGDFVVHAARDGQALSARGTSLVLAAHVPGLKAIAAKSPALSALSGAIGSLDVTLPFAVLRQWLDRPCDPSRAPFAGTAGLGILDNISLYERFEGESRRWAMRTGGSIVELHAYAVPEHMSEEEIRSDLVAQLHEAYPETRAAKVLEERYLLRRDCPSFAPGSDALRPTVASSIPGVYFAGDYVKLPFPSALMERATSSGFIAANEILGRAGRPTFPVEHGPTRGILPAFMGRVPEARS